MRRLGQPSPFCGPCFWFRRIWDTFGNVDRAERAAKNEALFRDVNERIEELGDESYRAEPTAFVCECSDPGCSEVVELTRREYEAVRAHGDRFAIVAGHELPDVERVVGHNARFAVVEKLGRAAEIARALDPRA